MCPRRGVALALVCCGALIAAWRPAAVAKPAAPKTLVYVNDTAGRATVFGFSLAADGSLTPLPGSPYVADWNGANCGGPCNTMAYGKRRKVLVSGTGGGVTVWRIATDGSLSVVRGSPFGSGTDVTIGTRVLEVGERAFVHAATSNENTVRRWRSCPTGRSPSSRRRRPLRATGRSPSTRAAAA